ncbi:ribosome maturation protein SDO1 [Pancytospora philotis]|nr:ribosome maturation protein SDO1 [Pancytospora philotis]KAI4291102.1 ribosome maturation protein SDO1 [Pancytospora philotis]
MLIRTKTKKLTNVSVVTLKKFNKKYEVAVYPNKLYEYRHNPAVPLESILHSFKIYRSVATGDMASESDLAEFGLPPREVVRHILDHGYEQKAAATSKHELDAAEKQILDLVQSKVTYNGTYVSDEILLGFIRSVWDIKNDNVKKQVSGIIRKLEEVGFERTSFLVRCDAAAAGFDGATRVEDGFKVKSDVLPSFISFCEERDIKYVIMKNEEVEEEEIC